MNFLCINDMQKAKEDKLNLFGNLYNTIPRCFKGKKLMKKRFRVVELSAHIT